MMEKIRLGRTNLIVTRSSFGALPIQRVSFDEAKKLLLKAYDNGINFFDTARAYSDSEEKIGYALADVRKDIIIATKSHAANKKELFEHLEISLKNLKTDYIDIYMPHFDDGLTPLEEIARGLEDLVATGKVLYVGLANFPAWKAAAIAATMPVTALQIEYNLTQRTAERELIGMAQYFGLSTMFYSPLAGGLLTGKYRKGASGRLTISASKDYEEDAATKTIIDELEKIAIELEASPGQIALAWTMKKNGFPIVGARTLAHLKDGLKALDIDLSVYHIARLDLMSAVTMGYPNDVLKTVQKAY